MAAAEVPSLRGSLQRASERVGNLILTPPRTLLVIALGVSVLFGRGARWVFEQTLEEGNKQLAQFNGPLQQLPKLGSRGKQGQRAKGPESEDAEPAEVEAPKTPQTA